MPKLLKVNNSRGDISVDISEEINGLIEDSYLEEVQDIDSYISGEVIPELMSELKSTSPEGKIGQYKGNWIDDVSTANVTMPNGRGVAVRTHHIYNAKSVGGGIPLSRLLEYGRKVTVDGKTEYVGKRPHIMKAANKAEKKIFEKLKG